MIEPSTIDEFSAALRQYPVVIGYFSTADCNVCKVLRPKIEEMLREHFPEYPLLYCLIDQLTELQGQFLIFAVPTIIIFHEGKELKRFSRHIAIHELGAFLDRLKQMMG